MPGESHGQGAWWATVHGVTKSQLSHNKTEQLSTLPPPHTHTHTHTHTYILPQESKERAEFLALLLSSLTRPRLETTAEANNPGPGGMCEIEDSQGGRAALPQRMRDVTRNPAQLGTHLWSQETEEGREGAVRHILGLSN